MSKDDFEVIPEGSNRESLEALSDHLILEASDHASESRTPSGLLIPASAAKVENGYQRYRVIAVGPMVGDERVGGLGESPIQPGDLVLAPASELGVYRENGQSYYIAHYDLIAAVIRRAD